VPNTKKGKKPFLENGFVDDRHRSKPAKNTGRARRAPVFLITLIGGRGLPPDLFRELPSALRKKEGSKERKLLVTSGELKDRPANLETGNGSVLREGPSVPAPEGNGLGPFHQRFVEVSGKNIASFYLPEKKNKNLKGRKRKDNLKSDAERSIPQAR